MNSSLREAERPSGAAPLIPSGLDAVLVLLRHGETEFIVSGRFQGQMDAPLTAAGERQIQNAAAALAAPRSESLLPIPAALPRAIVHSPLSRARRSAELVAQAYAAAGTPPPPLRPEPGLLEIAQGDWEGLTDSEIETRYPGTLPAWRRWPERAAAPGGETLLQVRKRVDEALAHLLSDLAEGTTPGTMDRHQVLGYADHTTERPWMLLVGHGGVFRVLLCSLLNLPPEHFWSFDFGLGAISVVEIRAGRGVLRALNLEPHLGRELEAVAHYQTAERDESGAL